MERSEQKKALFGVLFQPVLLVPMRIRIQGFDDQNLKKKNFTADKSSALQNSNFLHFIYFLCRFALLGPDPYPADQNQCGSMRIRIHNTDSN
jgi:hypothetical protein